MWFEPVEPNHKLRFISAAFRQAWVKWSTQCNAKTLKGNFPPIAEAWGFIRVFFWLPAPIWLCWRKQPIYPWVVFKVLIRDIILSNFRLQKFKLRLIILIFFQLNELIQYHYQLLKFWQKLRETRANCLQQIWWNSSTLSSSRTQIVHIIAPHLGRVLLPVYHT